MVPRRECRRSPKELDEPNRAPARHDNRIPGKYSRDPAEEDGRQGTAENELSKSLSACTTLLGGIACHSIAFLAGAKLCWTSVRTLMLSAFVMRKKAEFCGCPTRRQLAVGAAMDVWVLSKTRNQEELQRRQCIPLPPLWSRFESGSRPFPLTASMHIRNPAHLTFACLCLHRVG